MGDTLKVALFKGLSEKLVNWVSDFDFLLH